LGERKANSVEPLTTGNLAKLYCLNWMEQYIRKNGGKATILDLGCGEALNFARLLSTCPRIRYVGIEPSEESCRKARHNLQGLPTTIIHANAYTAYEQLKEKFDLVVSFSTFEHVYRRLSYLEAAKHCLKEDGYFLINYDAGHFLQGKEWLKNMVGPLLANLGIERYFQAFIREEEFLALVKKAGFEVMEAKSFNTRLKEVYKIIPASKQPAFMEKWLEFEVWLNSLGIGYNDGMAPVFGTRNFILKHKSR